MLSEKLLDDTMVLILSRLPAESLVRFKAVSKLWCQLIECPQFISEHHKTRASISKNDCLLIKFYRRNRFSLVYNHSLTWSDLKDLHRSRDSYVIGAPCNGIFCVSIDSHTVQLWNPAIRQYKTLPKSFMPDLEPPENFHCGYQCNIGLNFDPESNRYKVVRIWVFTRRSYPHRTMIVEDHMNKVEVWTPGNDSWRQINALPHVPLVYYDGPINLKRRCYWLAYYESYSIVSFDMVLEEFQATPLSNAICVESTGHGKHMRVATLNESIAVFSNPLQQNKECFDIWLMNGSDQGAWFKYMTVKMPQLGSFPKSWNNGYRKPNRMMYPLAFWNDGELVLMDEFKRLVLLNIYTEETTHTALQIDILHQIYVYNESLVSIDDWLK